MKNYKSAFTMIELIFVIIIIGVLSSIAVVKFGEMKITADIANARSDVAAIRSAIITDRQRSLVRGDASFMSILSLPYVDINNPSLLFDGNGTRRLLTYGLKRGVGAGEWEILSDIKYQFNSGNDITTFDYNATNGSFNCTFDANDCNKLAF